MLDSDALAAIITTPADSHNYDAAPARTKTGLGRYSFRWSWGSVTDPQRVVVTIRTKDEPVSENGSMTVFYAPACLAITVGGELVRDRYVGVGLYSFTYDEEKLHAPQGLDMVLRPLSSPVRPAPYHALI